MTHYLGAAGLPGPRRPRDRLCLFLHGNCGSSVPSATNILSINGRRRIFVSSRTSLRAWSPSNAVSSPDAQKQYAELLQQSRSGLRRLPRQRSADASCRNCWRRRQDRAVLQKFSSRELPPGRGSGGGRNSESGRGSGDGQTVGRRRTIDLAAACGPATRSSCSWLRDKDNRYFAPAFVNRVWANYFHTGIVNPPDDLSLANPPSNKPLMDYLTQGFIASGFDMKWLHRQIANSRTYQAGLATQRDEQARRAELQPSHATRRLPAEVLYDAIQQATASDEQIAQNAARRPRPGHCNPRRRPARNNRAGGAAYALSCVRPIRPREQLRL
jgi:hypothetical protein